MDYNLILSVICAGMAGIGAFFHTKYQSESNKQKIEDVKIAYEKELDEARKDLDKALLKIDAVFKKLDSQGEDIRGLQTEKEQFLTAKDADDIYLRIKEFDRFEKHIDKRFDSIESLMGKISSKLDNTLKEY